MQNEQNSQISKSESIDYPVKASIEFLSTMDSSVWPTDPNVICVRPRGSIKVSDGHFIALTDWLTEWMLVAAVTNIDSVKSKSF